MLTITILVVALHTPQRGHYVGFYHHKPSINNLIFSTTQKALPVSGKAFCGKRRKRRNKG
jgi:hypothetical protein